MNANVDEVVTETTETLTQSEAVMQFMINLFIALVMAFIGYLLVKILIQKIVKENEILNGKNTLVAESEVQTILVDGQEIETSVEVTSSNEEESFENIKDNANSNDKNEKKKSMSLTEVLLFAIPIGWMIIEWIYSLLQGFGG